MSAEPEIPTLCFGGWCEIYPTYARCTAVRAMAHTASHGVDDPVRRDATAR
jgi:hypothetical protein